MKIYDASCVECLGRDINHANKMAIKNGCTHFKFNGIVYDVWDAK